MPNDFKGTVQYFEKSRVGDTDIGLLFPFSKKALNIAQSWLILDQVQKSPLFST